MSRKVRVLLLGKSARLDAMAYALWCSGRLECLYVISEVDNPGLRSHATDVIVGDSADPLFVVDCAERLRPDFAIIGPEEPLAAGVVDALAKVGIPSVGPTKSLARIESSKSFARELISQYGIEGNPEYRIFERLGGLREYLLKLGEFVVKPDGLTGGKGVRVWGDHFSTIEEGLAYCGEVLESGGKVVIEEKLDGEEFSLQSFCDGRTVIDMPPVQDHKRQGVADTGPNTGGMGSYSCEDHLLPFLSEDDLAQASRINRAIVDALYQETGTPYKGVLYGGFILTKNGIRVIEYNARFGDPECMNVLPLLKTDFVDICEAIVDGTLNALDVSFAHKATVCKYVVPTGYPNNPVSGERISVPDLRKENLEVFQGAVKGQRNDDLELTGSRAVAVVGIGDSLAEAEKIAEEAASCVTGPVFHRRDIGTAALVQSRVQHMRRVRRTEHAADGHRRREAPELAKAL